MKIPWSDFGFNKEPVGQIWSFEILRFSGKHRASWTVGAAFSKPDKFGYITFEAGFFPELKNLLDAVSPSKGRYWRLVSSYGVLEFTSPEIALNLAVEKFAPALGEARITTRNIPDKKSRADILRKLDTLTEEFKALRTGGAPKPSELRSRLDALEELYLRLKNLSYQALIRELLSSN